MNVPPIEQKNKKALGKWTAITVACLIAIWTIVYFSIDSEPVEAPQAPVKLTERQVRDLELRELQTKRTDVLSDIAEYKETAEHADLKYFAATQLLTEIDQKIVDLQNKFTINKGPREVSEILINSLETPKPKPVLTTGTAKPSPKKPSLVDTLKDPIFFPPVNADTRS